MRHPFSRLHHAGGTDHPINDAAISDDSVTTQPDDGFEEDSLPDDLDFGGKTVNIYVRGDNIATEYDAENTGDIVDGLLLVMPTLTGAGLMRNLQTACS